jgi:hypothetical protein
MRSSSSIFTGVTSVKYQVNQTVVEQRLVYFAGKIYTRISYMYNWRIFSFVATIVSGLRGCLHTTLHYFHLSSPYLYNPCHYLSYYHFIHLSTLFLAISSLLYYDSPLYRPFSIMTLHYYALPPVPTLLINQFTPLGSVADPDPFDMDPAFQSDMDPDPYRFKEVMILLVSRSNRTNTKGNLS